MASVTGNGSKGHHSFTLEVNEVANSQSLENNTSDITFTFKIAPRTSGYNWNGWGSYISYKVIINGTEYSGTIPSYNGSSTVTLKSGTQTIQHDNDGNKTVAFSFSVSDSTGVSYTCGSASGSGTLALAQIPRASTISSITGNQIGSPITVAISKADNSFTHKLQVIYGEKRTDWIDFGSASSKSITVPMDFCNSQYLRNTDNGQCIFWLVTYSNGTNIATSQYLHTMYVPSSVVPTISSVTKSDTTSNLSTHGAYVQGKSNLRIQTSSNGAYSSTITNTSVVLKSGNTVLRTLTGNDVTVSNINYTGTITIVATVTDSRGRTATNTSSVSVATYENPKINSFTAERLNNDSTVTLKWNASITNINNHNSNGKTFKIYAREKGTSGWGTAIYTYTSGYSYTSNGTTITKDANKSWEFRLTAQDSYTTTEKIIEVGTAFDLVNYGPDGTTVAFGKVADTNKNNAFECDLDFYLTKKLYMYDSTSMTFVPIEVEIVDTW